MKFAKTWFQAYVVGLAIAWAAILFFIGAVAAGEIGCTPQQAKTAETVAVVVADDVCKVLEAQSDAVWVQLLCTAEGAASTVLVKMPRTQWAAIRASHLDAGPGK